MLKTARQALVLMVAATCLGQAAAAWANQDVRIQDDAGVLSAGDKQSIMQAARSAPYGVRVWTVAGGYAGDSGKQTFVQTANSQVGSNEAVIAVDTTDKYSHVSARQNTGLSSAATAQAKAATRTAFGSGEWGRGILAALGSLQQMAGSGAPPAGSYGNSGGNSAPMGTGSPMGGGYQTPAASGGNPLGGLVMLLVVIGVLVFVVSKFMGRRPGPYGPMNQGGFPGQVGGPGGFQQGYGPGYGQGGGMSSMAAGGLGAVGGGLLGYELGKMSGEHDNQGNSGGFGGGGFGGDNSGGFGGGGFGGGGGGIVESDNGSGGADFGGGGADFGGGGGDFGGGGGGGSDF